jgi:hypothetical protein
MNTLLPFRKLIAHGSAILATAVVLAFAVGLQFGRLDAAGAGFAIGLVFAACIGMPLYFLLSMFNRVNYVVGALAGLLIAAVPWLILTWPDQPSSAVVSTSVNGVAHVVSNVTTPAGWRAFWISGVHLGILGALSGLTYHWVTKRLAYER